jgi:hypothetical protein
VHWTSAHRAALAILVLVLVGSLVGAGKAQSGRSPQPFTSVSFSPMKGGVLLEARSTRARDLLVTVGGRRLARRSSLSMRLLIPAGLARSGTATVVVRDARSGATVAKRQLTFRKTAPTVAPALQIVAAPLATTTATSARVEWTVQGARSVTCSLDTRPATACASPLLLEGLVLGAHSLRIVATGAKGSSTSATVAWSVIPSPGTGGGGGGGTPPPVATVTFTTTPPATTTETTASFGWTVTGGAATICALDGGAPLACASPENVTGLAPGTHSLAVAAVGGATTTYSWTITAPVPPPPAGVAPPVPPSTYTIPAGAIRVTSAAGLASALAASTPVIILADGTYDQSTPFTNAGGSAIYAEHLGGALLRAGLVVGGNFGAGGGLVRGVVFDVSTNSKVLGGGIVHIWGPGGRDSKVLDCVFRGNWTLPVGLLAYAPDGLRVERSQFFSFTDVGLRLSNNATVPFGAATPTIAAVQDILIEGVSRATPGASDGTAEAGLWIGHPVTAGVQRVRIRDVAWSGIETVNNAWNTTFSDIDIDMGGPHQSHGVGIYLEHYNRNVIFERFVMTAVKVGFNGEWADPAWGGIAAAHNVTIRNGVIDSAGSTLAGNQAGVYMDEGSEATTVTGVTFRNQNWAGIGSYKSIGTNVFTDNTFALRSGAVPLSTNHM